MKDEGRRMKDEVSNHKGTKAQRQEERGLTITDYRLPITDYLIPNP